MVARSGGANPDLGGPASATALITDIRAAALSPVKHIPAGPPQVTAAPEADSQAGAVSGYNSVSAHARKEGGHMATVGGFDWSAFNQSLKKQRAARKGKKKPPGGGSL